MENYCVKSEMDKLFNDEDYIEITERQHERLSQKDIEYTDFLCWLLEQKDWGYDLSIIKGESYDKFYNSDEEVDMEMVIVESENFYKEFKKISNVDLFDDIYFISMTYIDEGRNDINLIVKENGINKRYVIGIVG